MNEIINIQGIECYEKDGTAYLKLDTVARGLGFIQTQNKNGSEYTSVRWETVFRYLEDIGFPNKLGKDGFIPENVFYRLAMKAKNETAERFQAFIADEVIPSIRKHGAYMTPPTIKSLLDNPDMLIQLATTLKEERLKRKTLETENAQQRQQIAEFNAKANYYDLVLQTKNLLSTSQIAKDYGKSAIWLNEHLHEKGIQFKQGSVWLLYQKYAEQGYTKSKTHTYTGNDGNQHSKLHTYWTQKGRLFIYELLKSDGVFPLIEQNS